MKKIYGVLFLALVMLLTACEEGDVQLDYSESSAEVDPRYYDELSTDYGVVRLFHTFEEEPSEEEFDKHVEALVIYFNHLFAREESPESAVENYLIPLEESITRKNTRHITILQNLKFLATCAYDYLEYGDEESREGFWFYSNNLTLLLDIELVMQVDEDDLEGVDTN